MANITLQSAQSLLIEMRVNGASLGTATGFVVDGPKNPVLVTNWHVLSGRHPDTKQPMSRTGGLPDEIAILHNQDSGLGNWIRVTESLHANGQPRWAEHPQYAERVDVVALPLTHTAGVQLYPHVLDASSNIRLAPAEMVSVIGFPFGMQAGGSLAVWATGFVASEPEVNVNDLPLILVDCRTRQGQSGSPVIAYRGGGAVALDNGSTAFLGGPALRFVGCYSGRINAESDIGKVWKTEAVREVVAATA